MESMTDQEALDQFKAGGLQALGWIYEKYRAEFVKSIGKKYRYSEDEALDLYHETVLELARQVSSGKVTEARGRGLGGWLYRTGINKCQEEFRRREEKKKAVQFLQSASENPGPDGDDIEEISLERLLEGMKKLEDRCRRILELFYLDQLPLKEIRLRMEYETYNAAKTGLYRCRETLKDLLFSPQKKENR